MRWIFPAGLLAVIVADVSCLAETPEEGFVHGMDLVFRGRYEDAEMYFLTLAREFDNQDTPEARSYQARALYNAGRIEHLYLGQPRRSVARLREALKLDAEAPYAFEARKEIAYIFYDRLRDYRTAAVEFERTVQSFPEREEIKELQYRIAQCYFLLREFDQARTEARQLLKSNAQGKIAEEALLLIANSYYVQTRYRKSVDAHQHLLDMKPSDDIESRSRFELGMCFQELGEYKKAEKNLLLALAKHPRPDLVKNQIEVLQSRMDEEDSSSKEKLPYAMAGSQSDTQARHKPPKPADSPDLSPKEEKPVKGTVGGGKDKKAEEKKEAGEEPLQEEPKTEEKSTEQAEPEEEGKKGDPARATDGKQEEMEVVPEEKEDDGKQEVIDNTPEEKEK